MSKDEADHLKTILIDNSSLETPQPLIKVIIPEEEEEKESSPDAMYVYTKPKLVRQTGDYKQ